MKVLFVSTLKMNDVNPRHFSGKTNALQMMNYVVRSS